MNNTLSSIIIFTAGAAIGSVVTWKLIKTKYEQIAQEEIDSVKEVFSRQGKEPTEPEEENAVEVEPETQTSKKYEEVITNSGYANYEPYTKEKEDKYVDKPHIISPEEFGENPDYEQVSLTYYADGILADEVNEVIEDDDVEDIVGSDSLTHFGEYEDDSVFVRNDNMKTDYEILLDVRTYADSINKSPHPTEG